jgi:ribosomal protein L11 methyltransferase
MRTWPALEVHRADRQTGDLIQAFLLDFGVAAIDDNLPGISRVFFHEAGDRDRAADGLRQQFPHISVRTIDVPDEDWAARSQASLHAIQAGNIIVAPPWDVPSAGIRDSGFGIRRAEPIVIVIQPSMGFGTGHHATTRLCLATLQQVDLRGLRVIDVGTGSGVLAIAASRLGAGTVVAIDDDPDAIAAARENLLLNPEARVALTVTDLRIPNPESPIPDPRSPIPGQFDVVVANLTGGLLIAAAARLRSLAAPSGRLVLSGLMESEQDDVLRAFAGLDVERRAQEDEWMCLELTPDRK